MSGGPRLLGQTTLLMLSSSAERLTGLLVTVLIGRALGAQALGEYSTVLALWNVFGALAYFGQQKQLARDVARRPDEAPAFLGTAAALALIASALSGALMVLSATVLGYGTAVLAGSLISACTFLWADAQCATVEAMMISRNRAAAIAAVNISTSAIRAVVSLAMLAWRIDILAMVAMIGVTQIGTAAALYGVTFRALGGVRLRWDSRIAETYARGGVVFMLSSLSAIVFQRVDTLILGYFSVVELGVYSAANRIAQIPVLMATPIFRAVVPAYARAMAESPRAVAHMAATHARGIGFFFGGLAIVFCLAGPWIVTRIFGGDFEAAASPLVVLAVCTVPLMIKNLLSVIALSTGLERPLLNVNLINGAISVVFNLALIPIFGAIGAAYVFLLVSAIGAAQSAILLERRRMLAPRSFITAILPSAIWSAVAAGLAMANEYFHLSRLVIAGGLLVCGTGHVWSHRSVVGLLINQMTSRLLASGRDSASLEHPK